MPDRHETPLDIDVDLDLTGVPVMGSNQRLRPGKYKCQIAACAPYRYKDPKTEGFMMRVDLVDVHSGDTIQTSFNVAHPKEQVREIGQKQYRTLLHYAGYPTPEKPDKRAHEKLVGELVGVRVVPDTYVGNDGNERQGSAVDSWHPFFDPKDEKIVLGPDITAHNGPPKANGGATAQPAQGDMQYDDIPF